MVENGLAYLEAVPGTRNRKLIRLTEKGRQTGESIVMPIFEAEQRAFCKLPSEDQRAFLSVLGKYISTLHQELPGTAGI